MALAALAAKRLLDEIREARKTLRSLERSLSSRRDQLDEATGAGAHPATIRKIQQIIDFACDQVRRQKDLIAELEAKARKSWTSEPRVADSSDSP